MQREGGALWIGLWVFECGRPRGGFFEPEEFRPLGEICSESLLGHTDQGIDPRVIEVTTL